jgi:imidazolonepropionase-like amidohydrolase
VGSLEVGKDGDVVIWGADPLHTVGAESWMTVVEGKVVYAAGEAQ